MVPPPSAVMQPSMQTPAQSMLRRPAANAAVIACAAIAISDSQCSTKSVEGRLHIESLIGVDDGTYVAGSILNSPQAKRPAAGTSAAAGDCFGVNGGTHYGLPQRSPPRPDHGRRNPPSGASQQSRQ